MNIREVCRQIKGEEGGSGKGEERRGKERKGKEAKKRCEVIYFN